MIKFSLKLSLGFSDYWAHLILLIPMLWNFLWAKSLLMKTGQDFHDDRSRFYYERFRISWYQVEIFLFVLGVAQRNEDAGRFSDLIFFYLVLMKRIKRQGDSKIPLCNPSGGKYPLRPSASYNKFLDRNVTMPTKCFCKKTLSQIFKWLPNTPLIRKVL